MIQLRTFSKQNLQQSTFLQIIQQRTFPWLNLQQTPTKHQNPNQRLLRKRLRLSLRHLTKQHLQEPSQNLPHVDGSAECVNLRCTLWIGRNPDQTTPPVRQPTPQILHPAPQTAALSTSSAATLTAKLNVCREI